MAIDPNIALGVRPIEQPNMLAQYGQMMQLRQMKQEYENEGGLRNALTGGLPDDPSSLLQYGKSGRAVYESALKGRKEKLESDDKRNVMLGGLAGPVMENPTPQTFNFALDRAVNYGLMTPAQKQEVMTQYGGSPETIKSYAAQIFKGSISAQAQQSDATSRRNADVTSGPGYLQAGIARERLTQDQAELARVRGILTGGATTPTAPPVTGSAPMGGGRLGSGTFNIPMGGGAQTPATGAATQPNVLATQVAPLVTTPPPVNALLNPPVGQTGVAPAANRVNQIKQQITQLASVGGAVANQALEGLIKEYNVLNPEGEIKITSNGTLISVNKRNNKAEAIIGADGKPVMGQVAPVTKDVLDPTDPARKRMITVEVNSYVAGTGLGVDGNAPPPKGVLGVAGSPIPSNYMPDPNNPQGVIPVPGSPADPNAVVAPGYRRTPDGTGQEFIPGGPADPKVIAFQNKVKLSEKDVAAREAKYPQATSALKGFEAKTKQFDSVINELIENKKGLDEITGFFAGRTDISAMSDAGRRALSLFNTITAKGGFSELQAMRNASPTGGALGNVSNQEGKQLIDSFGALSRTQSGDDLRKSLATAKADLQNLKERMREAYDLTYEYRNSSGGSPPLPPGYKAD
jgi:predicted RNA-binding protein Jag